MLGIWSGQRAFVATASVDKEQLVLDIIKVYKHRREKKEDWELIRAFVDAAYNYSQKKILLRNTDADPARIRSGQI